MWAQETKLLERIDSGGPRQKSAGSEPSLIDVGQHPQCRLYSPLFCEVDRADVLPTGGSGYAVASRPGSRRYSRIVCIEYPRELLNMARLSHLAKETSLCPSMDRPKEAPLASVQGLIYSQRLLDLTVGSGGLSNAHVDILVGSHKRIAYRSKFSDIEDRKTDPFKKHKGGFQCGEDSETTLGIWDIIETLSWSVLNWSNKNHASGALVDPLMARYASRGEVMEGAWSYGMWRSMGQ